MENLSQLEQQLTAHIRNPEIVSGPSGIEPRRAKIYTNLFYNNIEGFISSGFPILRELINDESWHTMVRDFMIHHQCHTPYFLEISQEFLLYLQNSRKPQSTDLPFMLELAHYEWVELALDVSDTDLDSIDVKRSDDINDLIESCPIVSPLAWSLVYQYPVNLIGPEFVPHEPPEQPTYLIVYRNRNDNVEFMQANAVTARLLELLQLDNVISGKQALVQLAKELQHPQPEQVFDSGLEILQKLYSLDVILGTQSV